jgi:hypothetical protein
VALGITLIVLALTVLFGLDPSVLEMRQHLGGEYYNIGRALADGRGFSDPFGERTGPTAWMPPLLPALIAAFLTLTGSRAVTSTIIVAITDAVWIATGTGLYAIARRCYKRVHPLFVVAFYLLWISSFNYWTFIITHDIWLSTFGAMLLVLATSRFIMTGKANGWSWGALGGFLANINPAMTFAWFCLVVFFAVRSRSPRPWLLALTLAVAAALPWTIRNAVTLHQFAPIKSNIAYDAYLANCLDEDGVYDARTLKRHPFAGQPARLDYAKRGEAGFMANSGTLFRTAVATNPGSFLRRIANRAIAVFIRYTPSSDQENQQPGAIVRKLIYPVPVIVFIISFWIPGQNRFLLLTLGLLVVVYLFPYVLVAFYIRYLLPLTPVLALIVFLGVDQIACRLLAKGEVPAT